MKEDELKQKTKQLALKVIKIVGLLPRSIEGQVIGKQFIRSATSIGANYRAACRSRSKAEFIAKLGIVEEEADETSYWLELIIEGGLVDIRNVQPMLREANEIVAIMAASRKSASGRNQ